MCSLSQSASDFCVSPDAYVTRVTKENAVINQGIHRRKQFIIFSFYYIFIIYYFIFYLFSCLTKQTKLHYDTHGYEYKSDFKYSLW